MEIMITDAEGFYDQLTSTIPTNLADSQSYTFQDIPQDVGPQMSFNSTQYPMQTDWQNSAERATNLTSRENPIIPDLLSYVTSEYSQDSDNDISSTNDSFYNGSYDQVFHQPSPTSPPQNSELYTSLSSSSLMQSDSPATVPWTTSETNTLQHLRSLGQSFATISDQIPGRSEASCRQRYSRLARKASSHEDDSRIDASERGDIAARGKTRWTVEEDEMLADVVARGGSFEEAARVLKGRSAVACRNRHYEYLGPWRSRKKGY